MYVFFLTFYKVDSKPKPYSHQLNKLGQVEVLPALNILTVFIDVTILHV